MEGGTGEAPILLLPVLEAVPEAVEEAVEEVVPEAVSPCWRGTQAIVVVIAWVGVLVGIHLLFTL